MKVVIIFLSLIICGSCELSSEVKRSTGPGGGLSTIGGGGEEETPAIVGGQPAAPMSAPYIVALHNNTRADYQIFCAASLLTWSWSITAAHCVAGINLVIIDLIAGTNNRDGTGPGAQKRSIKNVVIHPDYFPETFLTGPMFDVALVNATMPFMYTAYVLNIGLPPPSPFYPSNDANIWGWGSISYRSTEVQPAVLQTAIVPIVNYISCEVINLPSLLTKANVCSGPGDKGACVGDSGGPMTQIDTATEFPELMGVVSYGYVPCGSRLRPTVYSNVAYFADWIVSTQV